MAASAGTAAPCLIEPWCASSHAAGTRPAKPRDCHVRRRMGVVFHRPLRRLLERPGAMDSARWLLPGAADCRDACRRAEGAHGGCRSVPRQRRRPKAANQH